MKSLARLTMGILGVSEFSSANARFLSRERLYAQATEAARASNKQLVVVGDPNTGMHTRLQAAYGCGDLCIDITGCPACPTGVGMDLTTDRIPVADGAGVVYCSCVLEYVSDPYAAWAELVRVAGHPQSIFLVTVQTDTLTVILYPGAKWKITRLADGNIDAQPVTEESKLAVMAALGLGAYYSF